MLFLAGGLSGEGEHPYTWIDDEHLQFINEAKLSTVDVSVFPDEVTLRDEFGGTAVLRRYREMPVERSTLAGRYETINWSEACLEAPFPRSGVRLELLENGNIFAHWGGSGDPTALLSGTYSFRDGVLEASIAGGTMLTTIFETFGPDGRISGQAMEQFEPLTARLNCHAVATAVTLRLTSGTHPHADEARVLRKVEPLPSADPGAALPLVGRWRTSSPGLELEFAPAGSLTVTSAAAGVNATRYVLLDDERLRVIYPSGTWGTWGISVNDGVLTLNPREVGFPAIGIETGTSVLQKSG
jgi:hypothetical protein